jgi:DNA-binding CsgD family transcriptional regulator
MNHLTRNDYAAALRLLAQLESETVNFERFARAALAAVGSFVAAERATLSVCDPRGGQHRGVGLMVPLFTNGRQLVSILLNRRGLDFSERDRQRLELLRPHLAFLCTQVCRDGHGPSGAMALAAPPQPAAREAIPERLTQREGEVMQWLSCGKTDADIAALLAISPRTVHKHLEHIYVKLGVETRTAAVMRARSLALAASSRENGATSGCRPRRGTSFPGTRPSRGSSLRDRGPTA